MPYPIVTDSAARLWWKIWKDSGKTNEPPQAPEPETSVEGGDHIWTERVADLMDELGTLYDAVDGRKDADRGGVVSRVAKVIGRADAGKGALTNDRFEAAACVAAHKSLPRDAALADPEFWIWMATGPGLDLIRRRYPGKGEAQIPDRLNFTSANARETFYYRLWVRAELAFDPTLEDPYEIARYGDVDFWRSHVFRQKLSEAQPILRAFVKLNFPHGPNTKRMTSVKELRELIKFMKRAAANVLVDMLDEEDAERFVNEQWQKTQRTLAQTRAAE